ncbi:MAG TPA: PQQ-dependent sugar dehydrogenase [Solirubrobacterales bacterium]
MRCRHAILAAFAALMLAPATATAASLVPLAEPGAFESEPVFATSPPGDPRVFIVERGGGIRIVKDGSLLPKPFLTVENVDTDVERGLLSIAFPPDYASTGLFYVFTVATGPDELEPEAEAGQIRIVEYRRSANDPDLAEPDSARLVFFTPHDAGNHNGGQIMFGPEGLLYVTIGDDNYHPNAQNPLNDFGKVLRIDPRDPPGEASYSVPASNPTFPEDIHSALYTIGLRNPYRASFGPNGELIVADVGEGTWEEVDVGRATGTPIATTLGGANLGWPECEGFCEPPDPRFTDPVFEYPHSGPTEETTGCAILGGYVVRDPRLSGLTGRYLYGDLCRTDLRTLNLGVPGGDPQPAGLSLPEDGGQLRGFGEDSRGCVYVMTTETAYRVAPSPDAGTACPPLPPAPPGPQADRRPPGLKLRAPRHERLRRVITAVVTCDESCTLSATGWLRTSKAKASAACTPRSHRPGCPGPIGLAQPAAGAPDAPVELRLKLRKRAFLHAKAARRKGKRVKALVRVTASDPSGNSRTLMAAIVLR